MIRHDTELGAPPDPAVDVPRQRRMERIAAEGALEEVEQARAVATARGGALR